MEDIEPLNRKEMILWTAGYAIGGVTAILFSGWEYLLAAGVQATLFGLFRFWQVNRQINK